MKHSFLFNSFGEKSFTRGFTLIELILVIFITGLIFSVTIPVSIKMYNRYKSSVRAEEVLIFLSRLRRESFLYGREKFLESIEGALVINREVYKFKDIFVEIKNPIEFYGNGTTTGGTIKLYLKESAYRINIKPVFGDISIIQE